MATRVLVLAYGNPLRSDDGVAWQVADVLRGRCASARIVSSHQLTPEFAETAAEADCVLFIDAAQDGEPGHILCTPVDSKVDQVQSSHWLTPAQLIALCRQLYGHAPRAVTISIAGACFDHGETLSETITAALPELIDRAEILVRCLTSSPHGAGTHS
jgi:hydrogenase maturation protease